MKRALNIQGCFRKCPHPMRLKLERMWLFPHPLHPRTPACMTVHGEFSRCDWQCIKSPGHDIVTNSYFDCFYIFLQVEPMQHYRICKENPRWSNHSYKIFFHCCLCWICFLSEYGFFFLKELYLVLATRFSFKMCATWPKIHTGAHTYQRNTWSTVRMSSNFKSNRSLEIFSPKPTTNLRSME